MRFLEEYANNFRAWATEHHAMEAYKFTYLPSFHRSFEMMVWQNYEGNLQVAMELGPPYLIKPLPAKKLEGLLDLIAWQDLRRNIDLFAFWDKHDWEERSGLDGSMWYYIGLRAGIVKLRANWSPEKGEPAYDLGWSFFSLVPQSFCPVMTDSQAMEATRQLPMPHDFPVIIVY